MPRFDAVDRWQAVTGKNDQDTAELMKVSASKFSRFVNGLMALPMKDQLTLERLTGITPSQCAEFYASALKARSPKGQKSKKNGAASLAEEAA